MKDYQHPNRIASLPKGKKHWNWSKKPTILAMHKRIHRRFGPAKNLKCVDCLKQALDWSLKPGLKYSDNVYDYEPRCRSCHVKLDDKLNNRCEKISIGLKKAYIEGRR